MRPCSRSPWKSVTSSLSAQVALERPLCNVPCFYKASFLKDFLDCYPPESLLSPLSVLPPLLIVQTFVLGSSPLCLSRSALGKHHVRSVASASRFSVPARVLKTLHLTMSGQMEARLAPPVMGAALRELFGTRHCHRCMSRATHSFPLHGPHLYTRSSRCFHKFSPRPLVFWTV